MEKIFVTIRVLPLSKVEAAKGNPWKIGSNSIALCGPTGAPVSGQSYVFDKVFGPETSTLEIYETHTKDIIASAVAGFNGTVFAYGQTGSGKTYTMRGSLQEPGIIPLAVREIFNNTQEAENREFLLRLSYMEIHNEEIYDLLAPENRKLQVYENLEKGVFVAGLREEVVVSPEQVLSLLKSGETHRRVGETNMNLHSSRSHSVFRMVIESKERSHDDPTGPVTVQSYDAVRVSVLNLVDLAGSERVAKTGAEGARLKDGMHINKSLMTLGTVINKLSEGVQKQGGHVPYRDSKLTRILRPALGGNAKTAIICNITPAQIHVDETKGTLSFASRANRVTNCARVNELQLQESKKLFPLAKSMFSMSREGLPPLPPSFESLMECEDPVPPLLELDENSLSKEFQSFPSSGSSIESIFQETPPVFFCERKRRSTEKLGDEEPRQQLGGLQAQHDDFQLQHEILQHKMRETVLELKELKEELAFAPSAVKKARKLYSGASQSEDRRGKSLDGLESDGNVKQMRALKELEESREYAARAKVNREVQNQKEIIEAARIEQLALVEECKALRSALVSSEEEREALRVQNFQAQTELKEFDAEVQRQREEIEVAKHESMRAAEVIADLGESLEMKIAEIEQLEQGKNGLVAGEISRREELESETRALQALLSEKTAELEQVQQENSSLVERTAAVEHSLTAECPQRIEEVQAVVAQKTVESKIQELETAVSSPQTVSLEFHEQLESESNQEDTFDDLIEEFARESGSVERNRGIASPFSPKFRYFSDFGDDEGLFRNSRSLPFTSVEETPDIFQDIDESEHGARSEAKMLWIPGQISDVLAELQMSKCFFFHKVLSYPRKALRRRRPLQLYIPVCFLKEHGDKLGKWAILRTQSSSNSWRVGLCFSNKRSQLQIFCGWREFAINNDLRRGDSLIFVLNVDARCFQVYIFPETQREGSSAGGGCLNESGEALGAGCS